MYYNRSTPATIQHSRTRQVASGVAGLLGFSIIAGTLVAAGVAPVVGMSGIFAESAVDVFDSLPEYVKIDRPHERNTIWAHSSSPDAVNGYLQIATIYEQNRETVPYEQISPFVLAAAVDGEDHRFYDHGGVDLQSLTRAVLSNATTTGIDSGASTITMQLVKNIFVQDALERDSAHGRREAYAEATAPSFDRKLKEMKYAIGLEKRFTKKEILSGYLNIAFFGDNTYGIQAAAQRYFSVNASELDAAQSAALIAIVQYPGERGLDDPEQYQANQARRDVILASMRDNGSLSHDLYTAAVSTPVDDQFVHPSEVGSGCLNAHPAARWFCDYVLRNVPNFAMLGSTPAERVDNWETGGYDLYTSLDLDVQEGAQNLTSTWAPPGETVLAVGATSLSIEVGTGRILSMAENKNFDDSLAGGGPSATAVNFNTSYDYGGSSGFQSGSTYKLFTLIAWLQAGNGLYDTVNGSARTVEQSRFVDTCADSHGPWSGPYPFKNDSGGGGSMSVLSATANSVNGAYISMALELDLCSIRRAAESLGVQRADGDALWTNPSSVLGTNQVTPLSVTNAYATIAAGGLRCDPIVLDSVIGPDGALPGQSPACVQALDREVAAAAAYALAYTASSGTASASNPGDGVPLLGKTGTTDDAIQTWIVTSTTRVATGVWVGNIVGAVPLSDYEVNGLAGNQARHEIMRPIVAAFDGKYGGGGFPELPERFR